MILIPAIDIKGGRVVRLFQGRFDQVTDYGQDPLAMALHWQNQGAQWLHVVDLDGAKEGVMRNKEVVKEIAKTLKIPVEVGGGIRDEHTVEELIKANIARVIVGTKAIEQPQFLQNLIHHFGEKVAVSVDASNGFVAARGWLETTKTKATDLAEKLEAMGLAWMVYTDIAKDGTLAGPNIDQLKIIISHVKKIKVIASGGIGSLEDVKKLKELEGVKAAITGKAIYEGKLDFKKALAIC